MNTTGAIGESQAVRQLLENRGCLSHKEQLVSENRSERRTLLLLGRRLNAKQRAALQHRRAKKFELWKFLEKLLLSLPPKEQVCAGYILKLCRTFGVLTASAETIAERVGCHRNTVQKVFNLFHRHGLWVLNKRRWNNSSVRRIHPDFFNPNLYLRLWKTFDVYRDYFDKADYHLKIWLTLRRPFQEDCALILSNYNPSLFSKDDIQLYEYKNTHSREEPPVEDLSQKIAEVRAQYAPEHADLKALKAEAAREMSELLRGRVTATIHLSAKGQLHMMRYCDGALLYGLENLAHHGTIDNRTNYSLFESACIEYCRKNEIEIDAIKYDNLMRDLGYVESQPYCKKIMLDKPLSQRVAPTKAPEKAASDKSPSYKRSSSGRQYADLNPAFKDQIIAFGLRMGYEDRLDLGQNSNEKLDLAE